MNNELLKVKKRFIEIPKFEKVNIIGDSGRRWFGSCYNEYICSSCGYTFSKMSNPDRCPVCGAPKDKIKLI